MIYEMRTYRLKTGTVPAYLKLVEDEGIVIQRGHLGTLVGYFFSEIGRLNEIVHIWAYADLNDREARRAALAADPTWQTFLPKIQALIEEMENKILKAAPFSPPR
ncbi:NIPSNAP domain containing protein [Azospirillum sp. TSH100]|uniref:NIPSNAP family protein n=1 Tax=Azospirillum sp. TSH100 TaxID=652764 RepID=UPI000D604FE3|nr:NIPSNAP family protein [Azospirillum sp. TSH100]PWC84716.1 NIPSNAP domain containing protein [Azospirillum sp. TSH100]QCG90123.1 NIPSNAP family protein [Azospirillum sp. TSH100]